MEEQLLSVLLLANFLNMSLTLLFLTQTLFLNLQWFSYIISYCLETGTGPVFLYSTGAMEILHVAQPEMVKDMGHWTPSELVKPQYLMKSRKPLFGEGILSASGDLWAYERKILAPEFYMEKIKVIKFY
jgi:hypothetical protein